MESFDINVLYREGSKQVMNAKIVCKGDIVYSIDKDHIESIEQGYVVCENGICRGVYRELPAQYREYLLVDCGANLIFPGMTDLHVHAPQYTFRGLGMDCELLEWLQTYTFPEENKYRDTNYAAEAYSYFVQDLKRGFTTRAVIFATIHNEATIELMDQLEETGLVTYVGRVNMDRNGGSGLQEESAESSLQGTRQWLEEVQGRYQNTMPILTPRFIPTCSDELMKGLGKLAEERNLRIQSHLSENPSEIAWVKELVPMADCYANAYEIFGHMGNEELPTIMAHCVYSDAREMEIMKTHGVYVAHCPDSNLNICSGIAPVRKLIDAGLHVGLGTDVAGGSSLNMVRTMLTTLQVSKMYHTLLERACAPLTFEETFYLATLGGGQYFGKVGSFQEGYEFDALIVDDSLMKSTRRLSPRERAERMLYNDADCFIRKKFVAGRQIL